MFENFSIDRFLSIRYNYSKMQSHGGVAGMLNSIRIEFPVIESHFEGFGSWTSTYKNKGRFDGFVVL